MDVYLWYRNEFSGKKRRERISISLAGKGGRRIRLFYTSDYCGRLTVKIDKIRIYDYLGICSLSKRPGKSVPVAVLPDRKEFGDLVVSENYAVYSECDIAAASRPGDDPSEILEIREYLPGDRLNRIHWKRSAMTDGLFVKEFGDIVGQDSVTRFDKAKKKKRKNNRQKQQGNAGQPQGHNGGGQKQRSKGNPENRSNGQQRKNQKTPKNNQPVAE